MRMPTNHLATGRRRFAVLAGASLAGTALPIVGLAAGPASAANSPVCVSGATTATCTFHYSPTVYTWTAPVGVTSLSVLAYGGAGAFSPNRPGGAGAVFAATVTGAGGTTLTVATGGAGRFSTGGSGGGGAGGSGVDTPGGGGGGATVISAGATTLIVAGGGGGAALGDAGGKAGTSSSTTPSATNGAPGSSALSPIATGGGGGRTTILAGGGSAGNGPACLGVTAGASGAGGHGANCIGFGGGGGGGGYYGGGGGGNASGGGGGSSYPATAFSSGGITVTPVTSNRVNFGKGGVVITYSLTTTTTTLVSNPNPSDPGQPVTFTATVSPTDGGGSVSFDYNGHPISGCAARPLVDNAGIYTATCTTSTLPPGTDPVTAVYSGDPGYGTSTSNTVDQVVRFSTTTTLTSSGPNPSWYGQFVSFTATVSPSDGGGTVTFKNDGTDITGCAGLSLTDHGGSYQATCDTRTLPVGTDPITAVYSGDTDYVGSTSNTIDQVVNPSRTSLRAFGTVNPRGHIYVSARLTSDGQPVEGQTITFTAGPGTLVCTAVTDSLGFATCEASQQGGVMIALHKGVFIATFAGNADYGSSHAIGVVNGH